MAPIKGWSKKRYPGPIPQWLCGIGDADLFRDLSDIIPFIFLCCKLSIFERQGKLDSWASAPEEPKALLVKNDQEMFCFTLLSLFSKSLKLCDGQCWIELTPPDEEVLELLTCR